MRVMSLPLAHWQFFVVLNHSAVESKSQMRVTSLLLAHKQFFVVLNHSAAESRSQMRVTFVYKHILGSRLFRSRTEKGLVYSCTSD